MVTKAIDYMGAKLINGCHALGRVALFTYQSFLTFFTHKINIRRVIYQMHYIGVSSVGIVFLVGITVGAVLALQSHTGLARFGSTQFIGPIVWISMVREFGPILTAIMVIGRAGSAMTAELGSMRITEQIDALQTLCVDPMNYLVVPRVVASTFIIPFLSMLCSWFGIGAGYITSVYILDINSEVYLEAIRANVELSDVTNGLIKALVFGFLFSVICTYKGFFTSGGAKGVGISTTQSVVYSNVTIFVADYILTSLMFT